jgi:uncharacterized delta-60 repeat protein
MAQIQLPDPADLPRLRELGVIANMQPYWAQPHLMIEAMTKPRGHERAERLYPIADVRATGAVMAFGSDWPVSTPNPLLEMEARSRGCRRAILTPTRSTRRRGSICRWRSADAAAPAGSIRVSASRRVSMNLLNPSGGHMRTRILVLAAMLVAALGIAPARADLVGPGAPDPSFSGDGVVRTKLGDLTYLSGVVMQGNRPVVVGAARIGGEFDAVVFRYTRRGALDRTFSGDGKVRIDAGGYDLFFDVTVMPDGKLLAVGTTGGATRSRFLVVRFLPDGRVDRSFGNRGIVRTGFPDPDTEAAAALALPSGKAVVCGQTRDGAATFGGDGKVVTRFPVRSENACTGLGLATDGQVVASGTLRSAGPGSIVAGLARYRPNGRLEKTFDGDGRAEIALGGYTTGEDVLVLKNNFFLISGQWQRPTGGYGGYIAKLNTSGHLDPAFGKAGVRSVTVPGGDAKILALSLAPGGKPVGVGEWSSNVSPYTQFALITRLTPGGGFDGGFGTKGVVTMPLAASGDSHAADVKVLADGRIVLTGETYLGGATARLLG